MSTQIILFPGGRIFRKVIPQQRKKSAFICVHVRLLIFFSRKKLDFVFSRVDIRTNEKERFCVLRKVRLLPSYCYQALKWSQ